MAVGCAVVGSMDEFVTNGGYFPRLEHASTAAKIAKRTRRSCSANGTRILTTNIGVWGGRDRLVVFWVSVWLLYHEFL